MLAVGLMAGTSAGGVTGESKSFTVTRQRDTPEASGTTLLAGKKLTITAKGFRPNVGPLVNDVVADWPEAANKNETLSVTV